MTDDTKAKIKALDYVLSALTQIRKAKDARERRAGADLEVEFTDRIARLREADRSPELPLHIGEPALAGRGGEQ